ncbi:MAG: DMT family protein, partial [Muribaculaceae bacterium]|nr:DMT family protein [Muribaculaceae bacterium]
MISKKSLILQSKIRIEMKSALLTVVLLVISNTFMTFAWYGHFKMQSLG